MRPDPKPGMRHGGAIVGLLLLWWLPQSACLAASRHCLWEVRGQHNTIYLLGSVHMLRIADSALPPPILAAYSRSGSLMMELDLNDAGAEALLGNELEQTLLPEGESLSSALGPELYRAFEARAVPLGLEPAVTERLQPWFAALMLQQMSLAQSGFDANAGIDMQLAQRAQADHKPVIALETITEQLGYFSNLSLEQQRQFLRSTLKGLDTERSDMASLVGAWQNGDTGELERLMRKDAQDSPELFRELTTERNRRWLPKITALLDDSHDYLVIVGAMHLIGDDGIVELLRRQGRAVVQQ
jgi:uncharacterized protein